MATLTLHNLHPWAENYELTIDCACARFPAVELRTHRFVKASDGSTGLVAEMKKHPPTITIAAKGKLSGVPVAARDAPAVKAAVAAGALRISEDGSGVPVSTKSAGKPA